MILKAIRAEQQRRSIERERDRITRDADLIRARCQTLAGFVREAWPILHPGTPYVHGWHIEAICQHLEAITQGRITRLLINVPPGTMKSLLVSVFWPAWEWTFRPELQYLTTSYSEGYVKRDSRRMRDLVSSEWYQSLWGDRVKLARSAEISFENTARGFREGKPFASLTGGRGDRLIIDDPHSTETAESPAERENTIRVFRESVPTRLNDPQRSAIVIIMQRLHEGDVSGQAIALKLGYVHLMLPMEFEPERRCVTVVDGAEFFSDPRNYEGALLFPERFSREVVDRDKKPLGSYAVAGQFQQRPAPRGGGMFKRGWFEIVDAVPAQSRRARGWDLAASKAKPGTKPDWTAGVRVARDEGGTFYVEDVARFQGSANEVQTTLRNTATQDPVGTSVRLPQDPGQAGKAQAETLIKLLAGFAVQAKPVTGDKATRAQPAAAQAEAGNVKLLRGAWNESFLDELCSFPAGAHDDQVDAFADALNALSLTEPFQWYIGS